MGNENSQPTGLDISEKAVEVTDFWTLHSAVISAENETPLSVFIGEPLVSGSLWVNQSPLEKVTRALMIYRHPCIIKYVSSWNKGSKLFLAVENIKPLSSTLAHLSTLQICIGLHSILKALVFLHDNANVSHNNISAASIYVTSDGLWKLGGMEYFTRYSELNQQYLEKTRNNRYEKSIDPNESKIEYSKTQCKDVIDIFAFGVFVSELLRNKTDDEVPGLISFRDLCKVELQQTDINARPKLNSLLQHQFFTHDFIRIYAFLTELPLKAESEKSEFFTNLAEKLRNYSETIVAIQLGGLLLSRIVLLDATAQNHFVPFVFCPKEESGANSSSLFSTNTFQQYFVPRLLQIFCVRDAQIRLLLLTHFKMYMHCFTKEQLQQNILPELLVGIKDTNDHLVSVTLHTLADLVPVLGSTTVIGGKRAKLFNDGRPISHNNRERGGGGSTAGLGNSNSSLSSAARNSRRNSHRQHPSTGNGNGSSARLLSAHAGASAHAPSFAEDDDGNGPIAGISLIMDNMMSLPERPSPDGGEDETSTEELEVTANEEELDNWSDWDNTDSYVMSRTNGNASSPLVASPPDADTERQNSTSDARDAAAKTPPAALSSPSTTAHAHNTTTSSSAAAAASSVARQSKTVPAPPPPPQIPDITELDIKNQKNVNVTDEFDFFQDMEPVIETTSLFLVVDDAIEDTKSDANEGGDTADKHLSLSLKFDENESIPVDGWGDDLDWAENNKIFV